MRNKSFESMWKRDRTTPVPEIIWQMKRDNEFSIQGYTEYVIVEREHAEAGIVLFVSMGDTWMANVDERYVIAELLKQLKVVQ